MQLHLIPDWEEIEQSLRICEKWNAKFEYNDFFFPPLLDDSFELKRRLELYKGLHRETGKDTLHGVFFDICVNSMDGQIRQISKNRMIQSMELAAELDCKGVVFHTNLIPGFEPKYYLDGWREDYEIFYKELLRRFEGLDIYLENMFDYKPDMLATLAQKLDANPNFGVCFDVAHGHIHDVSMEDWFAVLAPYIKHLHINDNMGETADHLAVGSGTIDWHKYADLIRRYKIDCSMLVEVRKFESMEESLNYIKRENLFEL